MTLSFYLLKAHVSFCLLHFKCGWSTSLLTAKSGTVCRPFSGCSRDWFDLNFILNLGASLNSTFPVSVFSHLGSSNNLPLRRSPRKPGSKKTTETTLTVGAALEIRASNYWPLGWSPRHVHFPFAVTLEVNVLSLLFLVKECKWYFLLPYPVQ